MEFEKKFPQISPAIERVNRHKSINRKISSIEKNLDQCGKKSADLLIVRDQLVNIQNLIDACLNGADVPIWAELDRVGHLIDKEAANGS